MKKLIVSDIAKNGVQEAKIVRCQVDDTSKNLTKEANERIKADHRIYAEAYKNAISYFVR